MERKGLLEGQVALITGGGSGIGQAISLLMASEGVSVVVNDIDEVKAVSTCKKIGVEDKCLPIKADISNSVAVDFLVKQAIKKFGNIDIVVNNAGISPGSSLKMHTDEDWHKAFEVNLRGPFLVTRAALPYMVQRRKGRIINIASEAALHGAMHQVAYATTKGGLAAMTKSLARIVGPYKITANAICPGLVPETDMVRKFVEERSIYSMVLEFFAEMCPIPRTLCASDIASATLFLATNYSAFINGQLIVVNGGTV